jgi:hypothetical protein
MEDINKYKKKYVKNNIFLEDTFLEFNIKFSKLTDLELSELFWLWDIYKHKNSNKEEYIVEMKEKLGEDSINNILHVDKLSFCIYNKYELIFREIRNRWLVKFI